MERALQQAHAAAERGEVPIGAVIVGPGGAILAETGNRTEGDRDPTAHAELLAIRAAAAKLGAPRLVECDLYVTLEPCPMCMGACLNARVARVVYGAPEPKAGACGSVVDLRAPKGYNHAVEVTGGVRAPEAGAAMVDFFRALRLRRKGDREQN